MRDLAGRQIKEDSFPSLALFHISYHTRLLLLDVLPISPKLEILISKHLFDLCLLLLLASFISFLNIVCRAPLTPPNEQGKARKIPVKERIKSSPSCGFMTIGGVVMLGTIGGEGIPVTEILTFRRGVGAAPLKGEGYPFLNLPPPRALPQPSLSVPLDGVQCMT